MSPLRLLLYLARITDARKAVNAETLAWAQQQIATRDDRSAA